MPICKLCRQDKKLQKKSHIIPTAMLSDSKETPKIYSSTDHPKKSLTGPYDEFIMCRSCDASLGVWDQAVTVLFSTQKHLLVHNGEKIIRPDTKEMLLQVDKSEFSFEKIRLFILSLVWRASISTHDFFNGIKLSKQKSETLRRGILNGQALNPIRYQTFFRLHEPKFEGLTVKPEIVGIGSADTIKFTINSHEIYIKISLKPYPDFINRYTLHPNRHLYFFTTSVPQSVTGAVHIPSSKCNVRKVKE